MNVHNSVRLMAPPADLPSLGSPEFFEVAGLLGHDMQRLNAGEELLTYIQIPTLPEVRRILSRAGAESRRLRTAAFFRAFESRQRLGQGRHDRTEAFVFADGQPKQEDRHGLDRHLPVHAKAISVLHKVLAPGEVWDVSVRGEVWGLDDMEELCVVLNVGTLVMEPGSSLIVRGNVFSLVCQHVVRNGPDPAQVPPGADSYDIGILPTPFSVDMRSGPMNGEPGLDGFLGLDGEPGQEIEIVCGVLGPLAVRQDLEGTRHGTPGSDGEDGLAGRRGRNGGMCKTAEINLRDIQGTRPLVTVFSQAGRGGNGGRGGCGGDGGNGGPGAQGARTFSGPISAGNGGAGGRGGDGGAGGHGGSGGISSNIFISVPRHLESCVHAVSLPSVPGEGQPGGLPGLGGRGGTAGSGPYPDTEGYAGTPGQPGKPGRHGVHGRSRPGAVMFLNDRGVNAPAPEICLESHSKEDFKQ